MALFDTIRAGASGAGETYEIQNSLQAILQHQDKLVHQVQAKPMKYKTA